MKTLKDKVDLSNAVTNRGLDKVEADIAYLMDEFVSSLEESEHGAMTKWLPWSNHKPSEAPTFDSRLVQAYSIAFQLLNMVEENTANQIRRQYEREHGIHEWRGLWGHHLKQLKDEGLSESSIADAIAQVKIEPVLTAHPTESKRITVLELHRELYLKLVMRENSMWTPSEIENIRLSIRSILDRLWRTGEIYLTKPSIDMERQSIEYYLRSIFPNAVRMLDQHLCHAWKSLGYSSESLENKRPQIRFGSWVGGDRDGHPFVTPEVTERTLRSFRIKALKLHKQNLIQLRAKLSLAKGLQEPPKELIDGIAKQCDIIGHESMRICERNEGEPWRQFLSLMIYRIPFSENIDSELDNLMTDHYVSYRQANELLVDLKLLRTSLLKINARTIVDEDISPAILQCETFGFYLARLDIRQNSEVHERAISQIMESLSLKDRNYDQMDEDARLNFLMQQLNASQKRLHYNTVLKDDAEKTTKALAVIARHRTRYGINGLGALIVSMTRTVSDLLAVYFIARESGLLTKDSSGNVICPLQVVPLLETVQDLENGPQIIDAFLQNPIVIRSLKWIATQQEAEDVNLQVMIGYSDSNKDKGIFASQWTLHKAQAKIVAIGKKHDVRIRFFHGRGGTISRGAGPTDRFLEALPDEALNYDLRTTEQGESIAQKYANLLTATYNLDLLGAGTLLFSKYKKSATIDTKLTDLLENLSQTSAQTYESLKAADGFMQFYREATPIDVLEESRIGSRPSRRTGAQTLDDLRAIPWVFSWSLSRFFLPGWFGVGTALDQMRNASNEDFEYFKKSIPKNAFLRYLLTNVESSLVSTDISIMKQYAGLVSDTRLRDAFMSEILKDLEKATAVFDELFGEPLATRRPNLVSTVHRRNEALSGLHQHQVQLLDQWRKEKNSGAKEPILEELLLTVNAIASGLKMTG